MTLPDQQARAVAAAADFLQALARPGRFGRVPRLVRDQAAHLLHHFPVEPYIVVSALDRTPCGHTWLKMTLHNIEECVNCGARRDPIATSTDSK